MRAYRHRAWYRWLWETHIFLLLQASTLSIGLLTSQVLTAFMLICYYNCIFTEYHSTLHTLNHNAYGVRESRPNCLVGAEFTGYSQKARIDESDREVIDLSVLYSLSGPRSWHMTTWFAVIDRITQTRGIGDSGYKNVPGFDEGDSEFSFFWNWSPDWGWRLFSAARALIHPYDNTVSLNYVHLPTAHFRIRPWLLSLLSLMPSRSFPKNCSFIL
jgi:hypothetical protein